MSKSDIKRRLERLEVEQTQDQPMLIMLNCVDASRGADPYDTGEAVAAVITGRGDKPGEMLHREPDESPEDFEARIERKATQMHGEMFTVELMG